MSNRPFRFIVASDFHLEQPLGGVSEVPEHLRELFLEAPYTAAKKVFDAALAEDADFVLLAGDVLSPSATGPRGPLFLVEQFARLAERGIAVYWAGGEVDPPDAWPEAIELPTNVHVFPHGRVEALTIERNGEPVARLLGHSCDSPHAMRAADFSADAGGLYTIALSRADADPSALQTRGIHFWALGGRHARSTPLSLEKGDRSNLCEAPSGPFRQIGPVAFFQSTIHYCGGPQGRCPEESGVHGCTLVQVDAQRQSHTSLIPTDAARWLGERVLVDEASLREDLQARLRQRIEALAESTQSVTALISWTIEGQGPVVAALRRGTLAAELLESMRNDYGRRSPPIWSLSLETEPPETLPPQSYEQETILGDFLRAVRQLQMNPHEPLALEAFMAEPQLAGTLSAAAAVPNGPARRRVLREAAALGVELLGGEEGQS